jgi:glucan phosphoethanolaminetransferase (alkaline phosphatase superfamily)
MRKLNRKPQLGSASILLFLMLIINPEIRALLLLTELISAEVLLVFISTQLHLYWLYSLPRRSKIIAVAYSYISKAIQLFFWFFEMLFRRQCISTLPYIAMGKVISIRQRTKKFNSCA